MTTKTKQDIQAAVYNACGRVVGTKLDPTTSAEEIAAYLVEHDESLKALTPEQVLPHVISFLDAYASVQSEKAIKAEAKGKGKPKPAPKPKAKAKEAASPKVTTYRASGRAKGDFSNEDVLTLKTAPAAGTQLLERYKLMKDGMTVAEALAAQRGLHQRRASVRALIERGFVERMPAQSGASGGGRKKASAKRTTSR